MKRCRRTAFEITIEILLFVSLLIYIAPSFFRAQQNQCLVLLFKEMDRLICAVKKYKLDFGAIPPDVCKKGKPLFYLWGEMDVYANNSFPRILCNCGYLKKIPDFTYMQQPQGDVVLKVFIPDDKNLPTYAKMYWPFASFENHKHFVRAHFEERYVSGYTGAILFPMKTPDTERCRTWYAPSNGVDSAGYVYLDSCGEHSPFGEEIPRLLTLAE